MAEPENSSNVCRNKLQHTTNILPPMRPYICGLHRSSVGTGGLNFTAAVSTTDSPHYVARQMASDSAV
jgi:hypothetical protein